MLTWTPLVCFTILAGIYCISEVFAEKTHGYISHMVFGAIISLALFWTGLVPQTLAVDSTLMTSLSAFAAAMIIVNMGTTIELETLMAQWKTVVICCTGLIGLGVLAFTVGVAAFGKEYALCAAPPIAGAIIAYQIVAEAATAAGRIDLAGYAALFLGLQSIIGMPVASFCLKRELIKMKRNGTLMTGQESKSKITLPKMRLFKDPAPIFNSSTFKMAKLGIAAIIAVTLTNLTGGKLNVNISYLIVGVLLTRMNFLQKNILVSGGGYTFCIICMYALLTNGYAAVSPTDLARMILPIIGMFAIGVTGISIGSVVCGKLVGYSPLMSIAVAMTALFGYPGTEIISKEVCSSMENFSEEEKAAALNFVMPRMIVGGFTTVTIASVVFAGIVVPMIF